MNDIIDAITPCLRKALYNIRNISVAITGSLARGDWVLPTKRETGSDIDVIVFVGDSRTVEEINFPKVLNCNSLLPFECKIHGTYIVTHLWRLGNSSFPHSYRDCRIDPMVRDDLGLVDFLAEVKSTYARGEQKIVVKYDLQAAGYYLAKAQAENNIAYMDRAHKLLSNYCAGLEGVALESAGGERRGARTYLELLNTMEAIIHESNIVPLSSTRLLLQSRFSAQEPAMLFKTLQRQVFLENHGLTPKQAVSQLLCALEPNKGDR